MARPRNEAFRRELAARAFQALVRLGTVGVSMTQLARELDISRSLLYFYFPDQQAICLAALENLRAENRALVERMVDSSLHPLDQLIAYLDAVLAMGRRPTEQYEQLFRLAALVPGSPVNLLRAMEQNLEPFRRELARRLDAAVADGSLAPCDTLALVQSVRAFAEGLAIQMHGGGIDDVSPHRDQFVRFFLEPLRRTPDACICKEPLA